MPELPEVETVRAGLDPLLRGRRFQRVQQRRKDLRFPLPDRFVERLTGRKVLSVDRRAKYLVLPPTIDSKDIVIEVNTKLTEAEHCGEPFDDRSSTE